MVTGEKALCSARSLLVLLLVGTAVATLVTLLAADSVVIFWRAYGLILFLVAWLVLLCSAFVCVLEKTGVTSPARLIWLAFGFAQALVVLVSWAAIQYGGAVIWSQSIPPANPAWFVFRNLAVSLIVSALLLRYLITQRLWRERLRAESSVRLDALQARIRPHFLFNTLNTISSLIHDHPDQAEQATMDLADLLRTGLKDESTHALSDELDLIRGYLRIEQLRLGDRLKTEWEIADEVPLDQQLPPLLLQPLVENAVIHGISRRTKGGALRIIGKRIRFGRLRFTVTNPLADPDSRPADGNQSALENIRQRLALAYEERYGLKTRIEDGYFIAELTIPVT